MNFRDRILNQDEQDNVANDNELNDEFRSSYFGITNARSQPACFDLRLAEGERVALPYAHLIEVKYEPVQGIKIITTNKKVWIKGRELEKLHDYLVAYRVRYIVAHEGFDDDSEGLFVEEIVIEET